MPSTPPPLQPGETLEWERAQGTFHRGYDMGFAVSNRAAYLYIRRWSLRPRWIRLPLADLLSVEVGQPTWWQATSGAWVFLLFGAAPAWFALCVFPLEGLRGVLTGSAALAMVAWMLSSFIRAAKGRTRLVVNHARGRLGYTSYADTHADEKVYDRELIVEFARKLAGKGVALHVS